MTKEQLISYINYQLEVYCNDISQEYKAYIGELSEEDKKYMDAPFIVELNEGDMVLAISVNYGRNRDNPMGILAEGKCVITKNTLEKELKEIEKKQVRGLVIELRRRVMNHFKSINND